MDRMDYNLPFLLTYENVAWYENGKVRILDRRIYPTEIKFVECTNYKEVAKAIKDMVTQSAGPYTAVGMGMALAAYEIKDKPKQEQINFIIEAGDYLSNARPTTANRYKIITDDCIKVAIDALEKGNSAIDAIFSRTIESLNRRYSTMERVAKYLCKMFPKDGAILTQCFGETIVGMMLRECKNNNNNIKLICAETRPYLQGARLTSSCCAEMGFDTTVITDNMVAYCMQNNKIDLFTSAADTITRDGHIANKIGTFQIALLAKNFNIPYFVTGIPDEDKKFGSNIIIEQRDPKQVLNYCGIKNTLDGVKSIYPSFDITPPKLIDGIVTDKGIFSPYDLNSYFETVTENFY